MYDAEYDSDEPFYSHVCSRLSYIRVQLSPVSRLRAVRNIIVQSLNSNSTNYPVTQSQNRSVINCSCLPSFCFFQARENTKEKRQLQIHSFLDNGKHSIGSR